MDKLGVTITRTERTGSGHLKCYLVNGRFVIASCSASCKRALKNLKSCAERELNHKPNN